MFILHSIKVKVQTTLFALMMILSNLMSVNAMASSGKSYKTLTEMYDRQKLRSSYSLFVDRDTQSIIEKVGWQITQQLPEHKVSADYNFIVLDSHLVDVFHSDTTYDLDQDSNSIYVTRGLIALANHEGHLAAAIALKIAQFETDKIRPGHIIQRAARAVSELNLTKRRGERIFQRAAKLMAQANYDPAALLDWVLTVQRYHAYQQSKQQRIKYPQIKGENEKEAAQTAKEHEQLNFSYLNFSKPQLTKALVVLKRKIKSLQASRHESYNTTDKAGFMGVLDGLTYGPSLNFQLTERDAIVLEESGFRIYLPQGVRYLRLSQAEENFPFTFVALGQPINQSFAVAYHSDSQNIHGFSSVMSWVVIDKVLSTTPTEFLTQLLDEITEELTILQQQTIQGVGWQGAYMDTDTVIKYSNSGKNNVFMNNVSVVSSQVYALIPFNDKAILIRQGPLVNKTQFLSLVNNIRAVSETNQNILSPLPEFRLAIKKVQANDTMASLSKNLKIEDADNLLRVLNGLPLQSEPVAGQLVKVLDVR